MTTSLATAQSHSRTRGGGVREVFLLAVPVVLQNLSHTLLHVVDSAMVGRLGATELAAVGYGGLWIWTAICFFLGTSTGVQTFVSQDHGAGREAECGRWAWQALWLLVPATGLFVAAFAAGFPWLLEVLSPARELRGLASDYVGARSYGAAGVAITMAIASFFRGRGDMRTPLVATVSANVVNVVLDYGLIFGRLGLPALGVAGAGYATSISEWLAAGILIAAFARPGLRRAGTRPLRPERDLVRRLVRTGTPIGGQWFLDMITFSLFTTIIARMGSESMAASQAFVVLLHLSFMQVVGFQVAATTLVGRYIGAEDPEAAVRSYRSALALGTGYAGLIALLFLAVPELLIRIFTGDATVLALGMPLLAVGAAFQLFDAVGIVSSGALRGAGDTRWPFLVQTAMAWGLFLPLGYLGGVTLGGGLTGAWVGASVYVLLLAGVLLARLGSGAWRRIRI